MIRIEAPSTQNELPPRTLPEVIKRFAEDLNTAVPDLSTQRDRVLALNDAVRRSADIFAPDARWFIRASNRTIKDFELTLVVRAEGYKAVYVIGNEVRGSVRLEQANKVSRI